ncbi:MAG: DEAD/DEAH box helicase, partial [Phycisphaerae bacterium]
MIDVQMMVVRQITNDETFRRLVDRFRSTGGVVGVSGLWGSSAPLLCGVLADALKRPLLYITAHLDEADEILDDLETFTGRSCALLPAWEALPGEGSSSGEIHDERLQLCSLLQSEAPEIVVAPIQALLQPVPSPAALEDNTLRLNVGTRREPDDIVAWLVGRGFERLERVEAPGDFAQRGDIIDVYAPDRRDPVRLEFLDDTLDAVRTFDVVTQRSTGNIKNLALTALPHRHRLSGSEAAPFLEYFPPQTVVVIDRPSDVQEMGVTFWNRLDQPDRLIDPASLLRRIADYDQLHITRIGSAVGAVADVFHFDVQSLVRFEGKAESAVRDLCHAAADHSIVVYCSNEGERARLQELIVGHAGQLPEGLELIIGLIHHGFEWRPGSAIVVPHHEIFNRKPGRKLRRAHASRPIESVLDLVPGDLIVHVNHGIARYLGMKTMRKTGSNKVEEFLSLQFADKAVIHVTTYQIDLIQKYIGAGGIKPSLSKLGGTRWRKTKDRVEDAVSELAESLLRIQIERDQSEGVGYPPDTQWQHEFEESFMYEDTEDQALVSAQIKDDLMRPRSMDRLVCGDVGYGKTELAIRAAFKVVEYGKQVAVLVPTTVLAEQHHRTFTERLAEYPFIIGCLSRFKSPAEQKKLIEKAKKGQIDILIGTHRLLSKDVGFADLGLVVVDEEQRFGVEHKERLKRIRST